MGRTNQPRNTAQIFQSLAHRTKVQIIILIKILLKNQLPQEGKATTHLTHILVTIATLDTMKTTIRDIMTITLGKIINLMIIMIISTIKNMITINKVDMEIILKMDIMRMMED